LLEQYTQEAGEAGVFGAPSYVLPSGEIFWGQDRLETAGPRPEMAALKALRTSGALSTPSCRACPGIHDLLLW